MALAAKDGITRAGVQPYAARALTPRSVDLPKAGGGL
jgi:hypothetical protein